MWTSAHLGDIGWYLECNSQHVPDLEKDMFNSLEAACGKMLEGEVYAGLDGKACERLISIDKVKVGKVKDALEKNCLKEVEKKKKKHDDKAKEKTKNGRRRR
jgi:hypothetical protein